MPENVNRRVTLLDSDRERIPNLRKGDVSAILNRMREGQADAEEELITLVYGELRRLAAYHFRGERPGHTLQATALVHEAYLKLVKCRNLNLQSRTQFFAVASQVMRHILVDHARAHRARKRGGSRGTLSLEEPSFLISPRSDMLIALDEALACLAHRDPRQSRIVELRFFGGLSEEEIGELLGISARTVKRDWRIAKAWLYQQINS
jgi:RNA polymerase sigma factor (TIGR02999 family)